MKSGFSRTSQYLAWTGMKYRCNNINHASYKFYGGRGIKVCDRWMNYENFLSDMGPRPPGTSLDRINTYGDYEPSNCRWATRSEQANNSRWNHHLTHNGKTMTVAQWRRETGLASSTILMRIRRGWSVGEALGPRKFIRKKKL